MKNIKEIQFEHAIVSAALKDTNTLLLLNEEGDVFTYGIDTKTQKDLFKINAENSIQNTNGGFQIHAKSVFYILDHVFVLVNEYGLNGYVYNEQQEYLLTIQREDYYAEITPFPIALFYRNNDIHMLYSNAWNRVDVVNLETRQVLSADKSLIEEDAEKRHLEIYAKFAEHNKLLWPTSFDYFYGRLSVSHDSKYFASAGWVWGSFDYGMYFSIDEFLSSNRIHANSTYSGEHSDRDICWVNNHQFAYISNPSMDDNESEEPTTFDQIHIYDIETNSTKVIQLQTSENGYPNSRIYYNNSTFIIIGKENGVIKVNEDGTVIENYSDIHLDYFDPTSLVGLEIKKESIAIIQL